MYAPPVIPVSPARTRGLAGGPLLGICCLFIIGFLIAATIVLALIPVYIPRKGNASTSTAVSNPFIGDTNTDLGNDGNFDANARAALSSGVDKGTGVNPGTTSTPTAAAATTGGSRRRRALDRTRSRRLLTFFGLQRIYCIFSFDKRHCGGRCSLGRFFVEIEVITIVVSFTFNNFFFQNVVIRFEIFFGVFIIPPFKLHQTTTTTTTSTISSSSTSAITSAAATSAAVSSTTAVSGATSGTATSGTTGTASTGSSAAVTSGSTAAVTTATTEGTGGSEDY